MSEETQPVIVALRLPSAYKAWLQEQARQEERSVNYVARRIIERAMEEKRGAVA